MMARQVVRIFCICLVFVECGMLTANSHGPATPLQQVAKQLQAAEPRWSSPASGPLCGVYAACRALQMSGYDCSPTDFYSVKYVGSSSGSTPDELAAIGEAVHARPVVLSGLSLWDLRWLAHPIVANVRSTPFAADYDHWVVAEHSEGLITVFDREASPVRMSVAEFLSLWSGVAVLYAAPGQSPLPALWFGRALLLQLVLLCGWLSRPLWAKRIEAYRKATPPVNAAIRVSGHIVLLTALLTTCGMALFGDVWHFADGLRLAIAPSRRSSFERMSVDDLRRASASEDKILVDARRAVDYQHGSIPGAINIPVHASLWELREFLRPIDRDVPLVVFCQSAKCEFDNVVADNLSLLGFRNVSVCDGGWREYQQATASATDATGG